MRLKKTFLKGNLSNQTQCHHWNPQRAKGKPQASWHEGSTLLCEGEVKPSCHFGPRNGHSTYRFVAVKCASREKITYTFCPPREMEGAVSLCPGYPWECLDLCYQSSKHHTQGTTGKSQLVHQFNLSSEFHAMWASIALNPALSPAGLHSHEILFVCLSLLFLLQEEVGGFIYFSAFHFPKCFY